MVVYSALMDAFGKAGMSREASSIFQDMLRDGVTPNVVAFNSLIDAIARSPDVSEAALQANLRHLTFAPLTLVDQLPCPSWFFLFSLIRSFNQLHTLHLPLALRP